ncbi:hypothetical protein [Paraburkholderia tropica]|uniref:hypothetical protein n=1 Tax=Paraburkholderia tropica TaxID=92647 RepID=UPI002AB78555|nr:hypothetical protein [Paraburkholderia tropica]
MNRFHRITAAAVGVALVLTTAPAHADSITDYIKFEAGVGFGIAKDMGDGTWIQDGSPDNREKLTFPAVLAGFTGPIWSRGSWDLRWHAGYTYLGEQRASVMGVPDDQYNPRTHQIVDYGGERYSPFNGHGHVQGIPVTLDVGYSYRGWRFGAEAGAWVYWQTWHESLYDLAGQWDDLSHKTVAQLGYVVGASVERGALSLSYRYYGMSAKWNPQPGLVTGAHVVMLRYGF